MKYVLLFLTILALSCSSDEGWPDCTAEQMQSQGNTPCEEFAEELECSCN